MYLFLLLLLFGLQLTVALFAFVSATRLCMCALLCILNGSCIDTLCMVENVAHVLRRDFHFCGIGQAIGKISRVYIFVLTCCCDAVVGHRRITWTLIERGRGCMRAIRRRLGTNGAAKLCRALKSFIARRFCHPFRPKTPTSSLGFLYSTTRIILETNKMCGTNLMKERSDPDSAFWLDRGILIKKSLMFN